MKTTTDYLSTSRYFSSTLTFEHRPERPYDQQDASHLYCPNGSQVASFDPTFLTAAAPHVFALWSSASSEREYAS
jgi:hypothetical protein